jgi:hypothetical protein
MKYTVIGGNQMVGSGEETRETIRPEFDRSIMIDFQGAKITSDTGFLLLREIDERFGVLGPIVTWRILDPGFTASTLSSKWSGRGSIR